MASGPDYIPVVVLKNYESGISYILAEVFNMCLKESRFPDHSNILYLVPIFKNVEEMSMAKNHHPISFLSVVSKVFQKVFFSDFHYGFRSSADLLTVLSDRID